MIERVVVVGRSPKGEGEWVEFDDILVSRKGETLMLDADTFGLQDAVVGDIIELSSKGEIIANSGSSPKFFARIVKGPLTEENQDSLLTSC